MGALLALLGPLALALIPQLQAAFHHVAPTVPAPAGTPAAVDIGEAKMDVLLQQTRALLAKLVAINAPLPNGILPSAITVTDDVLRGFLESQYQQAKAAGGLTPAAPAGELYLLRGSVTAVK